MFYVIGIETNVIPTTTDNKVLDNNTYGLLTNINTSRSFYLWIETHKISKIVCKRNVASDVYFESASILTSFVF